MRKMMGILYHKESGSKKSFHFSLSNKLQLFLFCAEDKEEDKSMSL